MSLTALSKAIVDDTKSLENKHYLVKLKTQLTLIYLNEYSYWNNLSVHAAIVDKYSTIRNVTRFFHVNKKYDDWGRTLRTRLWG